MKYQFYLVENPKGHAEDHFTEQYILHAKPPRFIAGYSSTNGSGCKM